MPLNYRVANRVFLIIALMEGKVYEIFYKVKRDAEKNRERASPWQCTWCFKTLAVREEYVTGTMGKLKVLNPYAEKS